MAQGGQAKMRIVSITGIALAVCAMLAIISIVATAASVDTGDLNKSELKVCDNHKDYLALALRSEFLACHMCCAKKHKSIKLLFKSSEINNGKCHCVVQAIKEE